MLKKYIVWFGDFFDRHPLSIALAFAFVIRTVAAYANYGPFAIDDYQNVIEPAFRLLFYGVKPDIPSLRFEILPQAFALFMKPLYSLGVKRADILMSFAYAVMGFISLAQIIAMHKIGALLLSRRWQNAMTLFSATWFIVPLFTNSADIAGPAYILITFAMLYLVRAVPHTFGVADTSVTPIKQIAFLACGFYLSAAIFFRFSLAPLYFALAVWFLFAAPRGSKLKSITFFALGGALTAALMAMLEISNHKLPFSTAIEFIKYNFEAHIASHSYGSMPWYTYLAILAIFPLPILCFFFWYPMSGAARKYAGFTVLFLAFLVSHSAIAFKLERYVIPVLPIMTVYLFKGMENLQNRRWLINAFRILMVVNFFLVLPVALTMQQRAGVDGAIAAGAVAGEKFVYQIDPWRSVYYGLNRKAPHFAESTDQILRAANESALENFTIYRFMYFTRADIQLLEQGGFTCRLMRYFRPDALERLAIRLNPAMNYRRNDTSLYSCRHKT